MRKIYINLLLFCCSSMIAQTTDNSKNHHPASQINNSNVIARVPIDPITPTDPITPVTPTPPVNPVIPVTPTNTGSTEVGTTQGQLAVSLTGGATYSIPIAVPPGINGVVPQLSLNYNSQGGNGLAGYGWNISGISTISRIPSTKFHDGTIDAVDFDNLDRFAFDGQRLMLKSGTYGGNNTVYETENFSNVKITSYGTHPNGANFGPAYFVVEYPDGSKAYYGNSSDSRSVTDWSITYWENPQGVRISFSYILENNSLRIASINYGSLGANTPINQILFVYKNRQRPEQAYIGGLAVGIKYILSEIRVTGNSAGYRNYLLSHDITSLGYERLISITEKSGDNTKSYAPTTFGYDTTNSTIVNESIASTNISNISSLNSSTISGDYNGDGKMDFILYPTTGSLAKSKFSLFYDLKTQMSNTSFELNTGVFEDIFTSSFLTGDNTTGYKLLPKQGWTVVKKNTAVNSYTFSNYSAEGGLNPIQLQYEKTFIFPGFSWSYFKVCGSYNYSNYTTQTYVIPKKFINGDFNGDGLTDVIAIENELYYTAACDRSGIRNGGQTFLVDLDKRNTSTTLINSGIITPSSTNKYLVADFNGDGKSDLYVFNHQFFSVYSLNDNNQFEQLYASNTDSDLLLERPILMGDYNGDGKTDFLVPRGEGTNYAKYISTGNSYVKTYQVYPIQYTTPASYNYKQIIPNDINLDGKTDLIYTGSTNLTLPGYDHKYITVQNYKNNGDNFELESTFQTNNIDAVQAFAIPIFLNFDRNNPLIEINFISGSSIYNFASKKDFSKEKLLRTVTNGNKVVETITYNGLVIEPCSYNCKPTYSPSTPIENYPNIDISVAPGLQVVSKLETQSATVYKKQLFAYHGAVTNVQGLGFLGFKATMRTNWHDDSSSNPIISTVSKNDISRRGANIENYTVLYYASPSSSFTPTTYISKSVLDYTPATAALQSNKVFKLQNTKSTQFSGLDPSNSETITSYDSYSNPINVTTTVKEGSTTVQTSITNLTYLPPTSAPYVLGRPGRKTQTVILPPSATIPVNSTTSTENYFYTNHLLTQVEKSANASPDKITETNTYDTFGNITKKSISVPGLAARETNYQYDSSGRFLIKSTDIEGLSTTFNYNTSNGLLNSETNPYGLTTTYFYDSWFRKIKTTDYLGKSKTLSYARSGNNTILTATGDDGSQSIDYLDDLGRKYKSSSKDINSNFVSVDYEYDIYDRNIKVSEPYNGSATQWNNTEFDVYGRTIKNTSFTGKSVNISYSGLTTTVNDGVKTKTSIKNAIGKVVSMTDSPGGTILYTYFANGNLESSNYDGSKTTILQDAWGRKIQLDDPSAGIFTYAYNAFGETTSETSPNGTTTYTLDNFGKLISKKIVGFSTDKDPKKYGVKTTDSETVYTYDATTKLLTSSVLTDNLNNGTRITTNYQYDSYKRLNQTKEDTPFATFTKQFTFDTFGRTDTETSTALLKSNGKSSSKTIKNTYKNGFPWQILDNTNQTVLWQTNSVNARGQLIEASLGNNITIANTYDTYGLISQTQHNQGSANKMTLNTAFDAQRGNLTSRTNSLFNWNESFTYDAQDRLLTWKNGTGAIENQTYDNRGRIRSNALGVYTYTDKVYQNSYIQPIQSNTYKPNEQIISYTAFKSPLEIEEVGVDKISFTYNDGNDRTAMFYGSTAVDKYSRPNRKYYSADGSMEIKITPTTTEFITYIGGDGYSAPLLVKSDGITQNYLYLHRDYQGSILAITNQAGTIVEKRLFDAWGSLIYIQNGSGQPIAQGAWLIDRGYTGHEHLTSVSLINMNARLYDPKLHRFLHPDNYVQEPFNTQNYNRYAYCVNNPLRYTDPSGNWFFLVGVAVSVIMNGVNNLQNGRLFFSGADKAFTLGLIGSFMSFGVGQIAASIANPIVSTAVQTGLHALTGGAMSYVSGGNFSSGFFAGGVASLIGGAAGKIETGNTLWNGVVQIGAGGVAGGISSVIAGGDFANGFSQGFITAGLNHFAHRVIQSRYIDNKLESLGKKPYDRAQIEESELGGFAKSMFPKMMDQADDPAFRLKDRIKSPNGESAYGQTVAYNTDGVTHASHIEISRTALSSWHLLASTIGHELNHYVFYNSGVYDRWVRKFGVIRADALNEFKAHYWEKQWGGSPSVDVMNTNLRIFNSVKK